MGGGEIQACLRKRGTMKTKVGGVSLDALVLDGHHLGGMQDNEVLISTRRTSN